MNSARGRAALNDPTLNKGTAFSVAERIELGVDGLLPPRVEAMAEQCARLRDKYDRLHDDLERHIFLRAVHDANEVLFYGFVSEHLAEMLPILYTPKVGLACEEFSHIYRRPVGLFLSYPDRDRMAAQIAAFEGDVDVVVVTDGERIAHAVVAAAAAEGVGDDVDAAEIDRRLGDAWWSPEYSDLTTTRKAHGS